MGNKTRSQRWLDAISEAQESIEKVREAVEAVQEKYAEVLMHVQEVCEVQAEYADWLDNMPEGLSNGPTGEKLMEIVNVFFDGFDEIALDFDSVLSEIDDRLAEAEQVDFPLGFGRD